MPSFLALLMRLFPPAFRRRFGAEIIYQLERDSGAVRSRGRLSLLWFTLASALDLLRVAIAERASPTWCAAPAASSMKEVPMPSIRGWMGDFRLAVRALRRAPSFTLVALITLGLGIGASAAIFSVVDAVLLAPLPYADPGRLVYIAASAPGSDMPPEFGVAAEFYVQYSERSRLLENVAIYNSFTATLRTDDRVERVRMSWPTSSLFATLGAKPILGRLPAASDDTLAAVISYKLWSSWFGRDPSVIGRSYQIAGARRKVIGVMGPEFAFPTEDTMLWISNHIDAAGIVPGRFGAPLVGRMRAGVTPDAVARELTAISKSIPERFGGSASYARLMQQHRAVVRPLDDEMLGLVARPLWILFGATGIVLLIACANVANLFTVRMEGRQRELAVRRAIGAARGQLIRLQMAEALVVAGLAAVAAVVIAWTGLPLFVRAVPQGVPRIANADVSVTVLLFTLGAALLAAFACGLFPAIRASSPDLTRLREGSRGSTSRRHWGRDGLVVGQTALALVLLIGSGLLLRSFAKLHHVDPGYDTRDIFTFQIAPDGAALVDGPTYARFDMDFMERLRGLPGVESVGLVENLPLNESTSEAPFRTDEMSSEPDAGIRLHYTFAAGDYFRTMGIDVLAGSGFSGTDLASTLGRIVISRSAAERLWPGRSPIGQRLQRHGDSTWMTVIGVVDDVLQNDLREKGDAQVYLPLVGPTPTSWAITSPAYVVKTRQAESIAPQVRALVHEVAPSAPMYRVFTMAELARDSMIRLTFTMMTLWIASTLALILGAIGLYGVLSYVVAQRTREIGVRIALGAETAQVRRMVVAQGARVVAIGVALGLAAALASARALESLLYGVASVDPATYAGMSAAMLLVGLLASYLPALRASRVDPMESLRSD
jgi:predicted permease